MVLVMVLGGAVLFAQHTPVKTSDLPKAITDNIAKDYAGFTIKDATKGTENNVVTYNVVVSKGSMQETLCYDSSGKFLKKVDAKSGMGHETHKPAATTAGKNK